MLPRCVALPAATAASPCSLSLASIPQTVPRQLASPPASSARARPSALFLPAAPRGVLAAAGSPASVTEAPALPAPPHRLPRMAALPAVAPKPPVGSPSHTATEELYEASQKILDRLPKKQVYLFYCTENKELAQQVARDGENIELREIEWKRFADGFPNLFVPGAHDIRNRHVAFLASFHSPAVIFEQISIIYALPRMFVASFTLVLPFFPTGTAERMEDEGDVATAFTLSRILSNIPISRGGPTSVVIFDIHALQERFYFGDNVLPCFESGIPLLKERLRQLPDADNVVVAFPDEGAWKRFYKSLGEYETIICTKVRDGAKRIVRLKEGEPEGRHVVIVDDLVQSGSTLIECQKVLGALGASRVSAYVTHGVFPNNSWERFQCDNGEGPQHGFARFWITDSCPQTVAAVKGRAPFEILSLAGPIAAALHI
ncbi:phosphoribosyl transferase [Klebsormidium nitens]|uniref:ribose-phosphate diphosphokinase n=1 Tax=Klebsormidium nitens TaxID=105231 RepID=A0A0U9HK63_KLENI|nr:phosphoribosyl transferase [Klebsormidium nitens]|eukprot:GAQ85984.1 phosphoribosyl transferase [Klebsormidium nitens]